jgi:hypothetical protein
MGPRGHAGIEALDLRTTFDGLRAEIMGVSGPEALRGAEGREPVEWAYGVSGRPVTGYDAGYYTYLAVSGLLCRLSLGFALTY